MRKIFAISILMSTIVGVGMFALPYAGAQSGFLIAAAFLIILTGIMTLLHLLYGEIVARTKKKHRLIGYTKQYLGKKWGRAISVFVFIGFYGSLLVYIIVGGGFLQNVLSFINVSPVVFNLIFFSIGAIAIYFGLKLIAELDFFISIFLIVIVFLIFFFGFSNIDVVNFKNINLKNLIFPYGAILYALSGVSAIPEIKEILGKSNKVYKRTIVLGTLIPAVLYLLFMYTVIGLTGANTSKEAFNGLIGVLGDKVVFWGSLFGFLACITSFFITGLSLKKTFWYDFKINKNLSWLLACAIPLILFAFGFNNFISIIIILGALLGAIQGSAIVMVYNKVKQKGRKALDYDMKVPGILKYAVILVFVIGFIYTLVSII